MEVMTPEEVLGKENPPIRWHHGTCDLCHARNILVCHFGYDTQPQDYCLCKNCLARNLRYILYGKDGFRDGLLDMD